MSRWQGTRPGTHTSSSPRDDTGPQRPRPDTRTRSTPDAIDLRDAARTDDDAASVLLVDGDPAAARVEREMLAAARTPMEVDVVRTLAAARERLRRPVRCVLLALGLSDATDLEALLGVSAADPDAAVIVLTPRSNDAAGTRALAAGAQDVLAKDELDPPLLAHAVHHAVERKRADRALRDAEARFHSIVENSTDFVALFDAGGRLLYANPSARRLISGAGETLASLLALVAADDRPRVAAAFATAGRTSGLSAPIEFRLADTAGRRMIEAVLKNRLDDPAVAAIVVNARDVTEPTRLTRTLRTLSSCNHALVHAHDENELLHEMCRTVVEVGGYPLAWVGYAEDDTARTVRPVAAAGAVTYVERIRVTWNDDDHGRGPTGTAIRTRATQVCNDMHTDPAFAPWRDAAAAHHFGSSIVFPLELDGATLGAISIYAGEPHAFDDAAVELLSELAADLGYGIARLRDTEQLNRSMEGAIEAVAAIGEIRDPYTAGHQRRVARLAGAIAERLGMPDDDVRGLRVAGTVHDIGKIYVPAEILARPGALEPVEYELVKRHAEIGADILKSIDFPWPVAAMVRQHHERLDGSGYPFGLAGSDILIGGRILAVADVVEAIAHFRPYRPALGIDVALGEITKKRGTQFDAEVVDACLSLFAGDAFDFGP